jgi:hypothetical protein
MGKGKAASPKRTASRGAASTASKRRTSKHVDMLLQTDLEERAAYFKERPGNDLLQVFEESYISSLVNVLLDLKRSEVRRLFERLVLLRKRVMVPVITLYHYKEYLTNPLPLTISSTNGEQVPNYYAILGLPRAASYEDLKEAHRLLVKAYAPDALSPAERKAGVETLKEINEAYNALKNPKRREKTDTILPNISYLYPRRDQSWLQAVRRLLD